MMRPLLLLSLSLLFSSSLMAQPDDSEKRLKEQAAHFCSLQPCRRQRVADHPSGQQYKH